MNNHRTWLQVLAASVCLFAGMAYAEEAPAFRTDRSLDANLPWYQLVPGEFPPENSAHYISGELIQVDHLERLITIRGDRNDQRGNGDYPIEAAMLPFSSIYFHGAPAALQDIPPGTHLHGLFYQRPEEERYWEERNGRQEAKNRNTRASVDIDFTMCFRLEDDFSYYARQKQAWKIEQVDLTENKLTATLQQEGKAVGNPMVFDLLSSTRIFHGNGLATLKEIQPGQLVQFNLTWATLFGPGRITHLWLDEPSQTLASTQQMLVHLEYTRLHGLPGFVTAVDDKQRVVTITFFDGCDAELFKELPLPNPEPLGWPTSEYNHGNLSPKGNIVVSRECLMTYDQVNDRKGGNILKIGEVPIRPGCSGVQIQVKCGILLDGFRPDRIVKFFPATWPVVALPREEQFHGRE